MPKGQKGGFLGLGGESGYGYGYGYGYSPNLYTGYQSVLTETGISTGILQYLYYLIIVVIIGLFILVLVHYTLYPIFKVRPGEKGIVGLPGSDDSKLFWKHTNEVKTLKQQETPLGSIIENWSMLLDIQVDNPTANTNYPRILFTRGQTLVPPKEAFKDNDTILTINPNFNVCLWLERMTNDLNISIQTVFEKGDLIVPTVETISIPNVPVGKATRIGVMIGSRVLEVYVNGYLIKSKTFTNRPRASVGDLQPPFHDILSSTARVANLRLWNRPLTPAEFRSYGGAQDFDRKDLPDSCTR